MKPLLIALPLTALLLLAPSTWAQKPAATEEPALQTDNDGTTVVGDRESPIGLYITPWRNEAPEAELDRPARFLEEELLPLDADVFRRQLEYYNTITQHLGSRRNSGTAIPVK